MIDEFEPLRESCNKLIKFIKAKNYDPNDLLSYQLEIYENAIKYMFEDKNVILIIDNMIKKANREYKERLNK